MTKTLQEIQIENRKFILEAIHGCSYEEALEKELGVGCKIIVPGAYVKNYVYTITDEDTFKISRDQITEIIGKPLTLSRVLLALLKANKSVGAILAQNKSGFYINLRSDMPWDIKFETLEEQTEETQRGINELFNN